MGEEYLTKFQTLLLPLVGAFTLIYFVFIRKNRADKLLATIPGPTPLPIFGNSLHFLGPVEQALSKILAWCDEHGRRFKAKLGPDNFVFIWDEKDLEKLLSSKQHIEKGGDYDFIKPWLGLGLLTAIGEKWSVKRKMLTPSFHFKILDQFIDVFNEQSLKLVKILKAEIPKGKVFDISPYVKRCTLDIICETAMGKQINAQDDHNTPYLQAIHRMCELIEMRASNPIYAYSDTLWNFLHGKEQARVLSVAHGFTDEVIRDRKIQRKQNRPSASSNNDAETEMGVKKKLAFLDLLLDAQENPDNALTDEYIRQETDTFMFGGHDTTATNLGFSLFLFASHPKIQAKAQAELDEIFGEDRQRPISTADFPRLKYLENCLKESLRLYPSGPLITRRIRSDLELSDGVIIPAGTSVSPVIFKVHRDERHFPNPEEFNPDRWNDQENHARHPYAYIPFSAGPRNCIGQKFAMMEEKVIMAHILRNFKLTAAEKKEDLYLKIEITLASKSGIRLSLEPR
jgi:cytochrome P450